MLCRKCCLGCRAPLPDDLVFQSVKDRKPTRDNNILSRYIKPAARQIGLDFVNWRCLRTSYGTWLKRQGADMKGYPRPDAAFSHLDHRGHPGVEAESGR
jgi:hypothetical protein